MGYTIRDYVLDNISADIIKLELEYELEIITDSEYSSCVDISINGDQISLNYSINFDTKLSNFYDDIKKEIEQSLSECENCEKWKYSNDFISDEFTDLLVCSDECWDELDSVEYHNWLANY